MKTTLALLILLMVGTAMAQRGNSGDRQTSSGSDFVSRLDQDGDSKVSKTEFDGPVAHFSTLDANGDGYLSTDEAPSGARHGR